MLRVPTHRKPTHPGVILREEFLEVWGISVPQLSAAISLPVQQVEGIVGGAADEILRPVKVDTGREWVADEMMVNVMDADTRFVLAAYLTPERTARAAQTTLALAREGSNNAPAVVKTDGLRSYRQALPRAFPTRPVKHTVSQGIKAEINNNLSERLQGTFRGRDKPCGAWIAGQRGKRTLTGWFYTTTISGSIRVLRISGRRRWPERNCPSRIGRT